MVDSIAMAFFLFGLDGAKQAALLRLRARLTWRQYTGETGRVISAIMGLIFFAPIAIGSAIGSAIGYMRLPEPWPVELLGSILTVLWVIWIFAPMLLFAVNQGLDLTRVLSYPLSTRDLTAATLIGTVFDIPTYLVLPLFVAVIVGWFDWATLPIVLLALLLTYAQMVLIGQLILVAAGGLLRSRRFRDVMVIVMSLFGFSGLFCNVIFQNVSRVASLGQIERLRPMWLLQWLPPGAAARAIERATAGDWVAVGAWLAYAALLLGIIIWAWRTLFVRLTTGGGFLQSAMAQPQTLQPSEPVQRTGMDAVPLQSLFRRIPYDVRWAFLNELKSIWRTPQRRIGMLTGLLMPLIFGGISLLNPRVDVDFATVWDTAVADTAQISPWFSMILLAYAVMTVWMSGNNGLGWEGKGLNTLLLTPVPRARIFLGKGLGLWLLISIPLLGIGVILTVLTQSSISLAATIIAIGLVAVVLGATAVSSVLFPYPVNLDSTKRYTVGVGGSCLTTLANLLLVPIVIGLLALPIVAPLAAAFFGNADWWVGLSVLITLVYSPLIFGIGCWLAGRLLVTREPEVLTATRVPEGE